jgi:lipopolysaccharide/colanic/teichoic acid biosynthesis glycosyltransferase
LIRLRPRQQLLVCALLDLVGLLPVVALTNALRPGADLMRHPGGLVQLGVLYLLVGWLLGSYTLLRWPGLRLRLVIQRLLFTAGVTGLLVVLLGWSVDAPEQLTLLHRGTLLLLLALQSSWSLGLRLWLRAIGAAPGTARRQSLLASQQETAQIRREWQRTPYVNQPRLLRPGVLHRELNRRSRLRELAVAPGLDLDPEQRRQLDRLESRGLSVASLEQLAEQQLERLPPALLPHDWLEYAQLPWSNDFSFQRKLKRVADVALALLLLVLSTPVLVVAAVAIRLEDGGPVFYVQQRSGWLGQPFALFKLRTMRHQPSEALACWTVPGDQRITRIGRLLRPTRLDELPQLFNVLRGEMSLIGPRPERPQLETELECAIPHYRKRHWMPPGLSGWAQVCAPYAASVEEAELKLSYDLYYLRHWSTALDLLILAKTIKTVLKGAGR